MLSKLAFRNVRKTVRDYGVYLITMILVTALMFAFHSMMFSPQIQKTGYGGGSYGGDDRDCSRIYRPHCLLACTLYCGVYDGKTEPGVWNLSPHRDEQKQIRKIFMRKIRFLVCLPL